MFVPNAVFIPTKDGKEGRDFDRNDCTLLLVDGEYTYGEVYTEEAWRNGGEPSYLQRRGDFFLPDDSEIPTGTGATAARYLHRQGAGPGLLVRRRAGMTKRIFAVYALDRRQHFHLCEMCASYELHFVEHQYEPTDEVDHDEDKREELNELILDGGRYEEQVIYEHRCDIDPMFGRGRRCRPWLVARDRGGGYRLAGPTFCDLGWRHGGDLEPVATPTSEEVFRNGC